MKAIVVHKEFIVCPNCADYEFPVSHIGVGQSFTMWHCEKCGAGISGTHEVQCWNIVIEPHGQADKITVTLQSQSEPPITLKLNTWKYPAGVWARNGVEETPEEFWEHQRFLYNVHTCPTNYMHNVSRIIHQGSGDPHGVFEFVSAEYGWEDDDNE